MFWAHFLRTKGVLAPTDVKELEKIADARDYAAHGWYERIDNSLAVRVLADARAFTARYPVSS